MKKNLRRTVAFFITMCMLFTMLPAMEFNAYAADGVSVKIVSFQRGEQADLRSSELLVAQVEGYNGNVLDLTYEWTSSLGTYFYVYNSHNMYSINNTAGEVEIYNSDKDIESSENMAGLSYDKKFSGVGFAYAAIYGANLSLGKSLVGTVTVTVKDASGNVLATDSHTGTYTRVREGKKWVYKQAGFIDYDLQSDLSAIALGIFEGDTRDVKVLLGESGILHITCEECSVTKGSVSTGKEYISLSTSDGTYRITANKAGTSVSGGDAKVNISINKGNCKFHKNGSGTSTTTVYVYKKPVAVPDTTTIVLKADSLDSRCTYYIHGVEGTKQADGSLIFTGLTPNTDYEIEVMGKTTDTDASYAYIYTKTLPVFNANVEVYLNGSYNTETATPSGTLTDIKGIGDTDNVLYIKNVDSGEFYQLTHVSTGKYTAAVANGNYRVYTSANDDSLICEQLITVDGSDRTRYLFYYTVEYDANGGSGAPATEYIHEEDHAQVSSVVPTKEGYIFTGWKDADGNIYQPGDFLTHSITKAYKLTAQWEKDVKASVNLKVVANHSTDKGTDPNIGGDLDVHLTYRANGDESYVEVVGMDKVYPDWYANGTKNGDVTTVTYPGIYTDLSGKFEYSANVFIPHYEVTDSEITSVVDSEGNTTYDVVVYLVYNPDLFNLTYNTVADSSVPDELIPQAVDIKVISWNTRIADAWSPITRHMESTVDVMFTSADGRHGSGSYEVPVFNNEDICYYRVHTAGLTLADGQEITLETLDGVNYYSLPAPGLAEGAYTAVVDVDGGKKVGTSNLDGAYGVYMTALNSDYTQQGEITVTVYVNRYDIIFESNGGTQYAPIEDLFVVPELHEYKPQKSGYTFEGWYTDSSFTTQINKGDVMSEDITLYAKWTKNNDIKGTITVAGTYEYNGKTITILDADRATHVEVLLQKIDDNGYSHTIEAKKLNIVYENNIGKATYEFKDIPSDGSTWRIKVMNTNYGELYQNEKSTSTDVNDYHAYDSTHFTAEYAGDSLAVVNAYLPFDSAEFPLAYEIDATAIGDGYRPTEAGVLILCDEGLYADPQAWQVITQQRDGDGYIPEDTAVSGGKGSGSFDVWTSKYDGTTLYDYAIRVQDYTINGAEATYGSDAPFRILYNGSARYSAVSGQTQILKATFVPKMYTISFDTNAGEDEIGNMDSYLMTDYNYRDYYYWSIGKTISAAPTRLGYKFLGWFDADGNKVTQIDASSHEDITLTAQWEKVIVDADYVNNYAYIFGYNDTLMGAEGSLLRSEVSAMVHRLVKQNGKLGDFVYDSSNPSFNDISGEWFQSGIEFVHHKGGFTATEGESVYPYASITRGEAFRIICIGLGFTTETNLTNDDYANLLYSAGYIVGDENGNLNTGDFITRAEFCTIYNRIIGRENALLKDAAGNEITHETYGFTDLDPEEWYYDEMVKATSAYDENGYVDINLRGIRNNLDDYGA